ncbi:MAG: hypothetical protein IJ012_01090 [Clostridia bacterium]|nr:hypothetical protein [Clostridia bacterium]
MKKLLAITLLLCMLVGVLTACPTQENPPAGCTHVYQNGVCTLCSEPDPNYVPPNSECTHTYEAGVCTQCGGTDPNYVKPIVPVEPTYAKTYPYTDDDGVVHIRYQDTYTFENEIQKIEDVVITSKVTGTDTPDKQLFVQKSDKKSVYADACGSATFVFRGNRTVKVQVDPSPINLFFVTGQSNASGDAQSGLLPGYSDHYKNDYIRSPETMAYFSFCGQQISIDVEGDKALYQQAIDEDGAAIWHTDKAAVAAGNWKMPNFTDYRLNIPSTLDWETASVQNGAQPQQFSLPKGTTSFGNCGWNAALAYEWIQQTGERVWIVNASQGGMEIQQFLPSEDGSVINNEYYQAVAVFNLALETLYKEVDAGHFVLNHMAYYWFHGCSNSSMSEFNRGGVYTGWDNRFRQDRGNRYTTAEQYTEYFTKMHQGFMKDVVYDHNGVTKELEFCGVMTVRTKVDEQKNTFEQIVMTGARASQYYMGASVEEALKNVYVVSNVTEQWVGDQTDAEKGTNNNAAADAAVEAYFLETYGSAAKFKEIFGYDMPTTVYEIHPGVHYLMHGHNEMGMDCARNTLRIIRMTNPENCYDIDYEIEEDVTIRLLGEDGRNELGDTLVFDKDTKKAIVYPQLTPIYQAVKGIELEVMEGFDDIFSFDGYVLSCVDDSFSEVVIIVKYNGEEYGTYTFQVTFE